MEKFSPGVERKLKHYVYRLIDPRDGQTFYVGMGKGDRVFSHARGELKSGPEHEHDAKLDVIQNLRLAGLKPIYLIHRHGLTSNEAALVESALIDAFPGLTNKVKGVDSERGPRTVEQLEEHYAPEEMQRQPEHRLLIIKTKRERVEKRGSLYEAVRSAWKVDGDKAARADCILAIVEQVCVGLFFADEWKLCSGHENKPKKEQRGEFTGREIPPDHRIARTYIRKRLPSELVKQGAAGPIRYWPPANDPAWR